MGRRSTVHKFSFTNCSISVLDYILENQQTGPKWDLFNGKLWSHISERYNPWLNGSLNVFVHASEDDEGLSNFSRSFQLRRGRTEDCGTWSGIGDGSC